MNRLIVLCRQTRQPKLPTYYDYTSYWRIAKMITIDVQRESNELVFHILDACWLSHKKYVFIYLSILWHTFFRKRFWYLSREWNDIDLDSWTSVLRSNFGVGNACVRSSKGCLVQGTRVRSIAMCGWALCFTENSKLNISLNGLS